MKLVFTSAPVCPAQCRGTVVWEYTGDALQSPSVFTLEASYVGPAAPEICLTLTAPDGGELYASHVYTAAAAGDAAVREWRVPPMQARGVVCRAEVTVPEGGVLSVIRADVRCEERVPQVQGICFDAHLGFFGAAPENTLPAYEAAGICGFHSCICVPKLTKDGIFVCIHDDTLARTARGNGGEIPPKELAVKDMTYAELLEWDFGLERSEVFRGTKIPLLDEFFAVCEKYGMGPYFSIHPDFTPDEWRRIGCMLENRGLLKSFRVKSSDIGVLRNVYGVFGDTIGGYTLWNMKYTPDMPKSLASLGADFAKTQGTIEIMCDEKGSFTPEIVREVTGYGFRPSALSCWDHRTGRYYRDLLDMGVTEFTEDFHCSFGLNW